ncbi:exodeoxyribonuclease VII small subunit [Fundicoccus ignavus]|mgnify:CR=1 FL=1|uniref:Exodeoxyribonuclease 7 small subunit n=1 Tax=Fundicoccus ignavus TaxID=2664442 RepID=A0A6I2GIT3_9LACT|nr:exodeoxyribonuclease VII small subunit [Fundicoccus ignavus]MRI81873.1 exodeoxyribonuclease VII small subunit [Fundicoccus ignavus]MRI85189.1 exodeoxyribonuclease VII small subunit [Fundicoccus ignavus]MRJ48158.1 exodeoxyribonuclease VII small subunit [Fundicoccus ignavus]
MAVKKTDKPASFEVAIEQLEQIVQQLEKGELPLADALTAFKDGVELSQFCQKTLVEAEQTVAKMMTETGEVPLDEVKA